MFKQLTISSAMLLPALALACGSTQKDGKNANAGSGGTGGTGTGGSSGSTSGSSGSSGSDLSGGTAGNMPTELPPHSPPGSCGLDAPAFCEEFEKPHAGGNGGDIDESVWSFARWGHETRMHFVRVPASTEPQTLFPSVFCGKPFSGLLINNDVSVCDAVGVDGLTSGQLNEVYDDQGDFAINSMRPRQMFDFTGRTGTIVYDVDAKVNPCNYGHGWWTELWVTDDPAPIPYHEAPGVLSYPRNGFGINFQGLRTCPQGLNATEIAGILVTKDFKIVHGYAGWTLDHDSDEARCITIKDQKLNRFKILINKDTVEVWGSDYDDPENLHRMAVINDVDLSFEKGYVHLEHSQYNGRKDGCEEGMLPGVQGTITGVQTYRWDNVGFDGPTYATPRAYEVPYNTEPDIDGTGGYMYAYRLNADDWTALPTLSNVDLDKAKSATLDYSFLGSAGGGFSVLFRVNGGPTHTYEIPNLFAQDGAARNGLRAFTNAIPLEELMQGDNVVEFMTSVKNDDPEQFVGNVELTVNL